MEDEQETLFEYKLSESTFRLIKEIYTGKTQEYILYENLDDGTQVFQESLQGKTAIRLATILKRIGANG